MHFAEPTLRSKCDIYAIDSSFTLTDSYEGLNVKDGSEDYYDSVVMSLLCTDSSGLPQIRPSGEEVFCGQPTIRFRLYSLRGPEGHIRRKRHATII